MWLVRLDFLLLVFLQPQSFSPLKEQDMPDGPWPYGDTPVTWQPKHFLSGCSLGASSSKRYLLRSVVQVTLFWGPGLGSSAIMSYVNHVLQFVLKKKQEAAMK